MAASFVLARHCRLTISVAFTNVTRFNQRVVNLRGSTYRHGNRACLGRLGAGGYEGYASPPRIAAAALDNHFEHPARNLQRALKITFNNLLADEVVSIDSTSWFDQPCEEGSSRCVS